MRKFVSLFLSLSLIFSLAACSQSENSDTGSDQPPASNSLETTDMQAPENFVLIKGSSFQMGSPIPKRGAVLMKRSARLQSAISI